MTEWNDQVDRMDRFENIWMGIIAFPMWIYRNYWPTETVAGNAVAIILTVIFILPMCVITAMPAGIAFIVMVAIEDM